MEDNVIRILSSNNSNTAQSPINWSYSRQEFVPIEVGSSTQFHLQVEGNLELKMGQADGFQGAHRQVTKYNQGTQTHSKKEEHFQTSTDTTSYAMSAGQVSKSVIYDLYQKKSIKQRRSTNFLDFSVQIALAITEKLLAQQIGEKTVLQYYKWKGSASKPIRFVFETQARKRPVQCIAFHPHYEEIFAVCTASKNEGANYKYCDVFTFQNIVEPTFSIQLPHEATACCWSSSSYKILIIGLINGQVLGYNVQSQIRPILDCQPHNDFVSCIQFKCNKNQFVSTSIDGSYAIFQYVNEQYKVLNSCTIQVQNQKNQLVISGIMASQLSKNQTTPYLLYIGTETGELLLLSTSLQYLQLGMLKDQQMAIYSISVNHYENNMVATASEDQTVNIWLVSEQKVIIKLCFSYPAVFVGFCPYKSTLLLVVLSSGDVLLYDLNISISEPFSTFQSNITATAAQTSKSFKMLAIGNSVGKIYTYQIFDFRLYNQSLGSLTQQQIDLIELESIQKLIRKYQ